MQSSAIKWFRSVPRSVRIAVPAAAIALGAGACGSAAASNGTPAASHSATSPATSPATVAAGVTLETHQGAAGTFLTDASGRAVYLWHADSGMSSKCVGACATAWPPLTTTGSIHAGSGVSASDIGTITRSDGTTQITYNGHPLYEFVGDRQPGQTKGQGSTAFGAKWWLVNPAGQAITSTSSTGSSSYSSMY
jgi:predicted lipoprotein with Yx(FWY)xxD motif